MLMKKMGAYKVGVCTIGIEEWGCRSKIKSWGIPGGVCNVRYDGMGYRQYRSID